MDHEFGGIWTRKKLELLEKYMQFYTTALKNTPFKLHFIDAFAGTGFHSQKTTAEQTDLVPINTLLGSASISLNVTPPFDAYHFNDLDESHYNSIQAIAKTHSDKQIYVGCEDANSFVSKFCISMKRLDRAVIFLDPYNTELDWNTVELVAKTQKADLWLLFPISTLLRMTPRDGARIRPEWREKLNRLLGTDEWESSLYKEKPPLVNRDLFEGEETDPLIERIDVEELSNWLIERFQSIFSFTANPVMLKNKGKPLFLFIFSVSNPSTKAEALAKRVVKHIIANT